MLCTHSRFSWFLLRCSYRNEAHLPGPAIQREQQRLLASPEDNSPHSFSFGLFSLYFCLFFLRMNSYPLPLGESQLEIACTSHPFFGHPALPRSQKSGSLSHLPSFSFLFF
ncbi:hypothetical protein VNO77_14619 [Canavalia gladiata]|uniref:Uncharacterized protein n=1 Tax=Canavalia gladiata TaxID=3824 RepID=A0AAN9M3M1_CANGL